MRAFLTTTVLPRCGGTPLVRQRTGCRLFSLRASLTKTQSGLRGAECKPTVGHLPTVADSSVGSTVGASLDRKSVTFRKASLTNHHRNFAHVQQVPVMPGMYKHISKFEGEHIYNYGKHTWCILRESLTLWLIPAGGVAGFLATYWPVLAYLPLEYKLLYLAGLLVGTRVLAAGPRNKEQKDLTGQWVVVTGGTNGVGLATAAALARMGANVSILAAPIEVNVHSSMATDPQAVAKLQTRAARVTTALEYIVRHCKHPAAVSTFSVRESQFPPFLPEETTGSRDASSAAPPPQQRIEFHPLDLSDFVAIREYCKKIQRRHHGIDILVNNAGVLHQHQTYTRFGDDTQLAINALGPYLLTEGLLPLVRAQHGRIVYVSCSSHVAVRMNLVNTYLSGRGVWSPRIANRFDGLEQCGFTKVVNIFHAQDLALQSYLPTNDASRAGGGATAAANAKSTTPTGRSKLQQSLLRGSAADSNRRPAAATAANVIPQYTTCACNPGAVLSDLYRDIPMGYVMWLARPLLCLMMRSAREGAETVVNCCVRAQLHNGGYYMNCQYRPTGLSQAACSTSERGQVMSWLREKMQPYMKWE